jgi:CDP-paratose 2-epimerase
MGIRIVGLAIVTGSAGLVGAAVTRHFAEKGLDVIGIDNDMRGRLFGEEASTNWMRAQLEREIAGYQHETLDIRDREGLSALFARHGAAIEVVVHAAAQPSHDWAATNPHEDFTINANGTLNVLEATRLHAPDAAFIFTSTNKVYGDTPNRLPLEEFETRFEVSADHAYFAHGIDESMSIDRTLHSLFGASKLSADVLAQEYGRYFGLRTGVFRAGCITGPAHSATKLHGFLAYLVRCAVTATPYTVIGYAGKQVRDNIDASDLADAFWHFYRNPRPGEVYNIGGGRSASCSVLEAISLIEEISGRSIASSYEKENRQGDHVWWISDVRKFREHYPDWQPRQTLRSTIEAICSAMNERSSQLSSRD